MLLLAACGDIPAEPTGSAADQKACRAYVQLNFPDHVVNWGDETKEKRKTVEHVAYDQSEKVDDPELKDNLKLIGALYVYRMQGDRTLPSNVVTNLLEVADNIEQRCDELAGPQS